MANQTLTQYWNVGTANVVIPGTSNGLVSANGVPGNTTGSAIAAGYIGETIKATLVGISVNPSLNTFYDDSGTLSLTAGVWTIHCCASLFGTNPGSISTTTVPQIIGALRTGSTVIAQAIAAEGQVNGVSFAGAVTLIANVSISTTTVYKQSVQLSNNAGSPTLGGLGTFASYGYLYATRIA